MNQIRKIIKEDFLFQATPTFRFFFPNPSYSSIRPEYHSDICIGHPIEMINIWMPLTRAFDSNSMSYLNLTKSMDIHSMSDFVFKVNNFLLSAGRSNAPP